MSAAVLRPNARLTPSPFIVKTPQHGSATRTLPLHARHVDPNCEGHAKYEIFRENGTYSVLLTRRWTWQKVTFIILQTLKAKDSSHFAAHIRYGFVGEVGKTRLDKFDSADDALAKFCELFKAATGNRWAGDLNRSLQSDNYNEGKYVLLSGGSSDELMTTGAVPFDVRSADTTASLPSAGASSTVNSENKMKSSAKPSKEVIPRSPASTQHSKAQGNSNAALQLVPDHGSTESKIELLDTLILEPQAGTPETDFLSRGPMSSAETYMREVDRMCPNRDQFEVVVAPEGDPYAVVLEKLDVSLGGEYSQQSAFMLVQLLRMKDVESVFCFSRWGWFNTEGDHVLQEIESLEDAVAEFERQFTEASGNDWHGSLNMTDRHFTADPNKFILLDCFVWQSMCNDLIKSMEANVLQSLPHGDVVGMDNGSAAMDLTAPSPRGGEEEEATPKPKSKDKTKGKEKTEKADKKEKIKLKAKKKPAALEIDEGVEDKEGVTVTWSAKLAQNNGKRFYVLQLLEKKVGEDIEYTVHARVFKDGAVGVAVTKAFPNMKVAKAAFRKKFEGKTENKWLKDYDATNTAFVAGEGDDVFVLVGERP